MDKNDSLWREWKFYDMNAQEMHKKRETRCF